MAKKRGNRSRTSGEPPSDKKPKQDGKPQKPREKDHLEHIPFRLREIMKSKERMKSGPLKSKKLKDAILPKGKPEESQDGDIPVPHFKRGKHESVKGYLQRMEAETKHVLFLTNNQVDRKPELDADKQEKTGGKSEKKKDHDRGRIQRLQQKKLTRQEAEMEKEMFVDHVPFGEVSMAPPCLSAKPKKAPVKLQSSTKGLLLNSLLGNRVISTVKPSMARKRMMEEERERAVEAYRFIKKQRQHHQEARANSLKNIKDFD
ncbi:coiled-coil domain-containing protein 137 [Pleuronectes platessa]|uniref:coiled-coil domain-containing protein 137 n=1 Tax=Pleuronectes platessa TaxID=8262 RepID=UPI00232A22B1|nr:coiled-coil domain-containing protein 137 [Pleuronectes platessa]